MIQLDYQIGTDWARNLSEADLETADESVLRYDAFLGDVIFRADGADFSARWGWIPVLDFAISLQAIVETLATASGNHSEKFEFTESEAHIAFIRDEENVELRADYASETAVVSYVELRAAVESFLRRVVDELVDAYPALSSNPNMAAFLRT